MSSHRDPLAAIELAFGYSLFGFRPIVCVTEDGLVVRGLHYQWGTVREFRFSYGLIGPPMGMPRAVLIFTDGTKLKIDVSRFKKQGEARRAGFISGVTPAFSAFAHLLKKRANVGDPIQWGI